MLGGYLDTVNTRCARPLPIVAALCATLPAIVLAGNAAAEPSAAGSAAADRSAVHRALGLPEAPRGGGSHQPQWALGLEQAETQAPQRALSPAGPPAAGVAARARAAEAPAAQPRLRLTVVRAPSLRRESLRASAADRSVEEPKVAAQAMPPKPAAQPMPSTQPSATTASPPVVAEAQAGPAAVAQLAPPPLESTIVATPRPTAVAAAAVVVAVVGITSVQRPAWLPKPHPAPRQPTPADDDPTAPALTNSRATSGKPQGASGLALANTPLAAGDLPELELPTLTDVVVMPYQRA